VTSVKLRVREHWIIGIAWLVALGCSGAETARPPVASARVTLTELLTSVNARCPGLGERTSPAQGMGDKLFVEAVILEVSSAVARETSLANLQDLPQNADVQLIGTPHILGEFDHTSELALGPSDSEDDHVSVARLSALPRRADGSVVLDLELELDLPHSKAGPAAPRRTLTFTASARDNEPALARVAWDEASERSLLILLRTFEVRGEDDLRAIFQCKMREHAQALRRAGKEPPGALPR